MLLQCDHQSKHALPVTACGNKKGNHTKENPSLFTTRTRSNGFKVHWTKEKGTRSKKGSYPATIRDIYIQLTSTKSSTPASAMEPSTSISTAASPGNLPVATNHTSTATTTTNTTTATTAPTTALKADFSITLQAESTTILNATFQQLMDAIHATAGLSIRGPIRLPKEGKIHSRRVDIKSIQEKQLWSIGRQAGIEFSKDAGVQKRQNNGVLISFDIE